MRFRSTPCAFWRVPACRPSGFMSGTTVTSVPAGGDVRSSANDRAMPAASSPWMHPTTSRRRGADAGPSDQATSTRPRTERPSTRRRRPDEGFGVVTFDTAVGSNGTRAGGWATGPVAQPDASSSASTAADGTVRVTTTSCLRCSPVDRPSRRPDVRAPTSATRLPRAAVPSVLWTAVRFTFRVASRRADICSPRSTAREARWQDWSASSPRSLTSCSCRQVAADARPGRRRQDVSSDPSPPSAQRQTWTDRQANQDAGSIDDLSPIAAPGQQLAAHHRRGVTSRPSGVLPISPFGQINLAWSSYDGPQRAEAS